MASSLLDPIPDSVPLTSAEKLRKEQLEAIVAGGLAKFLEVGQALCRLRNERLYRTEAATFENYVQSKFGMHRSSVDGVIRSAQTAQVLLDAGLSLPPDTTPTSLRAISALPGNGELKAACWQLAEAVSPGRTPTQPLVSRLCRLVRNCIEGCESSAEDDSEQSEDEREMSTERVNRGGSYHGRRSVAPPQREVPFLRSTTRLVNFDGFYPQVIVADIDEFSRATTVYNVCQKMISRCEQVQRVLVERFPQLINDAYVEHHQGQTDPSH